MPNRLREHDARASTRGFPLRLAHWMKGFAIVLSLSATHAFAQQSPAPADGVYNLLVGTYTGHGSDGIYVYRFDTKTGSVVPVSSAKTVNPSYLLPSRDGRTVYAVNELPGDNGPANERGGVSAFGFDAKTGALTFIDRVSSEGNDPCYLALSPDGKYLVTANYSVAADPGVPAGPGARGGRALPPAPAAGSPGGDGGGGAAVNHSGAAAGGARHPCEQRRAWAGVDAPDPVDDAGGARGEVRRQHTARAPGATRGARTRLRSPGERRGVVHLGRARRGHRWTSHPLTRRLGLGGVCSRGSRSPTFRSARCACGCASAVAGRPSCCCTDILEPDRRGTASRRCSSRPVAPWSYRTCAGTGDPQRRRPRPIMPRRRSGRWPAMCWL